MVMILKVLFFGMKKTLILSIYILVFIQKTEHGPSPDN